MRFELRGLWVSLVYACCFGSNRPWFESRQAHPDTANLSNAGCSRHNVNVQRIGFHWHWSDDSFHRLILVAVASTVIIKSVENLNKKAIELDDTRSSLSNKITVTSVYLDGDSDVPLQLYPTYWIRRMVCYLSLGTYGVTISWTLMVMLIRCSN